MRARATALAIAGLAWVSLVSASVRASEPSPADKATARGLMEQGYDALDRGDAAAAVQAFRAADALIHVPTTAYAFARADVAVGRLLEANEALVGLERMPVVDGESADFTTARRRGAELLLAIKERIPEVRLVLDGMPADTTVSIQFDDEKVPVAVLGTPRKVDPGAHVVVVEAGGLRQEARFAIQEHERQTVHVRFPQSTNDVTKVTPAPGRSGSARPIVTASGFALAGAGLAAGVTSGLLAISAKNSALAQGCVQGACPPSAQPSAHRAETAATLSTVSFVVAGIGAALAIAGLAWPRASMVSASNATSPTIGVGADGITGVF
jgi:hypothetical protein